MPSGSVFGSQVLNFCYRLKELYFKPFTFTRLPFNKGRSRVSRGSVEEILKE